MATAALRGILVVGAFLVGMLVIAKAFPEGPAATQAPVAQPSPEAQTPAPTTTFSAPPVSTTPTAPGQSPGTTTTAPADLAGVSVQVLNGTNTSGLAASAAEQLEGVGMKIVAVANSQRTYEITTIFYRADSQAIAEALAQTQFPGARLEAANNNLNPDVQVTVVLGEDHAAQQ